MWGPPDLEISEQNLLDMFEDYQIKQIDHNDDIFTKVSYQEYLLLCDYILPNETFDTKELPDPRNGNTEENGGDSDQQEDLEDDIDQDLRYTGSGTGTGGRSAKGNDLDRFKSSYDYVSDNVEYGRIGGGGGGDGDGGGDELNTRGDYYDD